MIIASSPEYEGKLEHQYRGSSGNRLASPTGISIDLHKVLFNKVDNAESYSIFIDGSEFANVPLLGTNRSFWLYNELIEILDDVNLEISIPFISNDTNYSVLKIYGRNQSPTGKYAIYYDNTLVFEETDGSSSLWKEQVYRTVSYASAPTGQLLEFLTSAAESQPEQLSIDVSALNGWEDIENGHHILQLVARASNIQSSFLSYRINFGKNTTFAKGIIYGPYTVVRVIDGDTVVAMINGAEMKVRMIGVNTPESVATAGYRTENCQEGIDASNYTKTQLTNRSVYLEFDNDIYDRYNRYLCYIYLDLQGTQMYNAKLISEGYGEAQYYSPNGAHKAYLESVQATARTNGVRYWGTGFFPTKLVPPAITLTGSTISWDYNRYTESYDIKDNGTVIYNYTQPDNVVMNTFNLTTLNLSAGSHRINLISKPTNSTHQESNNSNNITYVVS